MAAKQNVVFSLGQKVSVESKFTLCSGSLSSSSSRACLVDSPTGKCRPHRIASTATRPNIGFRKDRGVEMVPFGPCASANRP